MPLFSGSIVNHLLDIEYLKKYKDKDMDCSVDVGCSAYLRDFLLLTGSDDTLIRVWDVKAGRSFTKLLNVIQINTLIVVEHLWDIVAIFMTQPYKWPMESQPSTIRSIGQSFRDNLSPAGQILHRLSGHSHDVSTLMASETGERFLSYSSYTEEEAFRLWDGHSFTCLATFKADDDVSYRHIRLSVKSLITKNRSHGNATVIKNT